jgi:hypothetical protein
VKAVTSAAEEPRPVLWAEWRGTWKFVKVLVLVLGVDDGIEEVDDGSSEGCE